jgi:tetratricopeptide (TPR) repeat protein
MNKRACAWRGRRTHCNVRPVQSGRDDSARREAARPERPRSSVSHPERMPHFSVLFALGLLLCPVRLLAQSSGSAPGEPAAEALKSPDGGYATGRPPSAAVEHYLQGRKWYLAGRYRDALVELKAALEYDPQSADLLYNVARVYENLRLFDEAIAYYQRYLERLPADADDERDKTDKTIRRLQGAKREFEQQQRLEHSRAAENPQSTARVGRADFAFWLTGSVAGALLAAGGVTGVLALKKTDDVTTFVVGPDGSVAQRARLVSQADQLALATDLLLAGGAVAFTGAVLLFLLRDAEPDAPTQEQPVLSVGFDGRRAQLTLRGAF